MARIGHPLTFMSGSSQCSNHAGSFVFMHLLINHCAKAAQENLNESINKVL